MDPSHDTRGMDFRTAFCQKYRCAEADYERSVLRRCFPWWVRALGSIVLALNPRLFRRELALISRLGAARDETPLRQELEGYAYENARDKQFRTETLGLRLSRRRFVRLMRTVLPTEGRSVNGKSAEPG